VQIGEHTSELGRWRVAYGAADPRLRPYVHGYIASSSQLPTEVRERHLPVAEVPLFVNFGAPHRSADPEAKGGTFRVHDGAWIGGLRDGPALSEAVGERHFMIVRFTPVGAHLFLGIPMHALAGRTVGLDEIDSGLMRRVMRCVGGVSNVGECFTAMEALIAERTGGPAAQGIAARAWDMLAGGDGRIAVGSLAAACDCSHRHLISQFQTCIGVTPKSAERLFRFNRAVRLINRSAFVRRDMSPGKPYIEAPAGTHSGFAKVEWADIAAECGYFDQPHFIREFRQFAGATPSTFLRQVADID
jgi:AraC-like DNA-binding protein